MKDEIKKTSNETTVTSYSKSNSKEYEDPMNKNFLYGVITTKFLQKIELRDTDKFILDIGCGTGFAFDELYPEIKRRGMTALGIEPATGMLDIARDKYKDIEQVSFQEGSFEKIPCPDHWVDRITSTLALHWVKKIENAVKEMHRALKEDGRIDILMIAKDDGDQFRKGIVEAMKKHMTFPQIMKSATLAQRVSPTQAHDAFALYFKSHEIIVEKQTDIIYGTFEEHMKWWKARSTQIIAEVKDKDKFLDDLRIEFQKMDTDKGIPFDNAYLEITVKPK
jgi:ubiquinone/menaquinone biosynthesis C-methylase UbiE